MMTAMTSRERVQAATNHQEPDCVPLDLGGGSSTTIVVEGYERLKKQMGLTRETVVMNKAFRLARLDEEVMEHFGSDTRPLTCGSPVNRKPRDTGDPDRFVDIWGTTWRKAFYKGGYYWELEGSPLAEADIDDLETYDWPDPLDPGFTSGVAEAAEELYRNTDCAIMADGGFKSFWETAYALRGFQQLLIDIMTDVPFVSALLEKLLEINIAGTRRFLEASGKYITVFRTADDLATQSSLLMSPETYRTILKPFYKKYFDFVHSMTDAKLFYHSCGKITDLLDDLIEIGVDIINPVQVSAMGDTRALKAQYGDRIVFWGGIDTQHVLPAGSTEDVKEEVHRRILDLAPGGGYVVGSVHNIQPDVPTENILAMVEATHQYGRYPLN